MFRELIVGFLLLEIVNLSDVSFYEILGVSKESSSLEIRQAYKKLAIKLHPDKNQDESDKEKFLKITEAYETLKDPEKRRKYDTYGIHQTYTRQYDYHSQKEYNNMFYNGLYHEDPFVDTVSGKIFYSYLEEGFHFINFYSPFCPPCQSLADHWKKLAAIYQGIVKVAAVNCKYHNSFCYNSMRISSYPSLLFYPEGRNGDFVYYRGAHTLKALEDFVLSYIESKVYVQTLTYIKDVDKPVAYVLGKHRIDRDVLTRIAYHLMGLVTVVIIEDDNIRGRLTNDDYTTVVFKYRKTVKELTTSDEKEILSEIVEVLPEIEPVDPDKFKEIRNQLRNGYKNSWALYFSSSRDQNRLHLHQMRMRFPIMHFGEINCDKWVHLCLSLQAEDTPAWALLKSGGGYQKAPPSVDFKTFLRDSPSITRLHSLMPATLHTLHEDEEWWVVLVAPHKSSWGILAEAFTRAALHLRASDDINFGTVECTKQSADRCREVTSEGPAILMQNGHKRDIFNGEADFNQIVEFIQLVKNSADLELSEQQVLEIVDVNREHAWLVAFLPPGHTPRHKHTWRLLADKLRPLAFVRVGVLQCGAGAGFCANVRAPTARLYPIASGQHFSVSLQQVSEVAYLAEWALSRLDDCVQLSWGSFSQRVLAEDLQPHSGRKPWLVYFHSPRCHRCYEMYADFAIAGIQLNNAVNLGKVNCLNERGICQHEHISSYPSLRLYLGRNARQRFSSVVIIPVQHHQNILDQVKAHLTQYDDQLLAGVKAKHDEL